MANQGKADTDQAAVHVARLYYYERMTTAAIAEEMGRSRATVSRLLSYANDNGLVEIRIHDPVAHPQSVEKRLLQQFGLQRALVVPVAPGTPEADVLQRVARRAAAHLNALVAAGTVLGIAWGKTVQAIAGQLTPRQLAHVEVVQLNGSGTGEGMVNSFGESLVTRFAQNYGGRGHSFPVPAFFDYAQTREALWRERSVQQLRKLQDRADILLFSIGAPGTGSHVHTGGYLDNADKRRLQAEGVAGDIATVFFREDGSWRGIAINARSSGPELDRFQRAPHSLCVVAGPGKLRGLRAALRGGLVNELVIDEPTATALLETGAAPVGSPPGKTPRSRTPAAPVAKPSRARTKGLA